MGIQHEIEDTEQEVTEERDNVFDWISPTISTHVSRWKILKET